MRRLNCLEAGELKDNRGDRFALRCGHDLRRRLGTGRSDRRKRDQAAGPGRDTLDGGDLVPDFAAEGDPGTRAACDREVRPGHDPAAAAAAAKGADVAIVFAYKWASEGMDLKSLSLASRSGCDDPAVAAANPHTIVVLETGNPVTMPWVEKPAAILEAWFAGSDGANAVGNVLFGTVNPSGKLPNTFPKSEADLPHPTITMPPPESSHFSGAATPEKMGDGLAGFPGYL